MTIAERIKALREENTNLNQTELGKKLNEYFLEKMSDSKSIEIKMNDTTINKILFG